MTGPVGDLVGHLDYKMKQLGLLGLYGHSMRWTLDERRMGLTSVMFAKSNQINCIKGYLTLIRIKGLVAIHLLQFNKIFERHQVTFIL